MPSYDVASIIRLALRGGVLPEISRAWATVDNALFLWRFDVPDDVPVEYSGEEQAIVAVGLARPKRGVFLQAIEYVLVVATTVEVVLLGVCLQVRVTIPGGSSHSLTLLACLRNQSSTQLRVGFFIVTNETAPLCHLPFTGCAGGVGGADAALAAVHVHHRRRGGEGHRVHGVRPHLPGGRRREFVRGGV